MNHDQAKAFVRQAVRRVVTEDDYPALDTWDGCAARLVAEASASAQERSG
ncbi:hypothetical protein [Streptomyces sp. NPDC056169]